MTAEEKDFNKKYDHYSEDGVVILFEDTDINDLHSDTTIAMRGSGGNITSALALVIMHLSKQANAPAAVITADVVRKVKDMDMKSDVSSLIGSLVSSILDARGRDDDDDFEEDADCDCPACKMKRGEITSFEDFMKAMMED